MAGVLVASGLTIDEQFAVFNIQSETGFRVIVRWRMGSGIKRTLPVACAGDGAALELLQDAEQSLMGTNIRTHVAIPPFNLFPYTRILRSGNTGSYPFQINEDTRNVSEGRATGEDRISGEVRISGDVG